MAASKRQMNWTAVGFTPSGGSLTTFSGVTSVSIKEGGTLKKFAGDTDKYPTTVVNDMNDPTISITVADIAALSALATGTVGTVTATSKDAKGATGGDILYTLSNAVVESFDVGGQHTAFGQGTLTFSSYSSDGVTSPLSFTRA